MIKAGRFPRPSGHTARTRCTAIERMLSLDGQIALTKSFEDAVAMMERAGADPRTAKRIGRLDGQAADPDEQPINLESPQKPAAFIVAQHAAPPYLPCS